MSRKPQLGQTVGSTGPAIFPQFTQAPPSGCFEGVTFAWSANWCSCLEEFFHSFRFLGVELKIRVSTRIAVNSPKRVVRIEPDGNT